MSKRPQDGAGGRGSAGTEDLTPHVAYLRETEAMVHALRNDLEHFRSRSRVHARTGHDLNDSLRKTRKQHTEEQRLLERRLEVAHDLSEQLRDDVQQLQDENAVLVEQVTTLATELVEERQTNASLREDVFCLETQIDDLEEMLAMLHDQLAFLSR